MFDLPDFFMLDALLDSTKRDRLGIYSSIQLARSIDDGTVMPCHVKLE